MHRRRRFKLYALFFVLYALCFYLYSILSNLYAKARFQYALGDGYNATHISPTPYLKDR